MRVYIHILIYICTLPVKHLRGLDYMDRKANPRKYLYYLPILDAKWQEKILTFAIDSLTLDK